MHSASNKKRPLSKSASPDVYNGWRSSLGAHFYSSINPSSKLNDVDEMLWRLLLSLWLGLERGRAGLVWKGVFEQLAKCILFFHLWIFQAMPWCPAPPAPFFTMCPFPSALQQCWAFCAACSPPSLPPQGTWSTLFPLPRVLFCLLFIYHATVAFYICLCDFSVFFSNCPITSPWCPGPYLV